MERFLEHFAKTGMVSEAARLSSIARRTAYDGREQDAEFAAAWDEVDEASLDRVEKAGFRIAEEGDAHMIRFILQTRRASRYREVNRHEVTGAGGGPVVLTVQPSEERALTVARMLIEAGAVRELEAAS